MPNLGSFAALGNPWDPDGPEGTERGVLPAADPDAVPGWLTLLRNVGQLAAVRPVNPPRRLLLSLPTGQLAAATAASGAVAGLAAQRITHPLEARSPADVGARVSAFVNGGYRDTRLSSAGHGRATVAGGTTMTTFADTIRVLPAELPDRPDRKLKSDGPVLTAWATAALTGVNSPRLHARCSATPVVVIGQRSTLAADLCTLEEVWPGCSRFLDVDAGLRGWFRHPVLVCDVRTRPPCWLGAVRAALVVCDGAAAWRSELRRALPDGVI